MLTDFATADAFAAYLRDHDGYRTPRPVPRIVAATPRFHWRLILIYMRAARIARRGEMDDRNWAAVSFDIMRQVEAVGGVLDLAAFSRLATCPAPAVIVANHMGTLETVTLPCLTLPFRRIGFVIKSSLLDYPIFGHVMRAVPHVAVGRQNPRADLEQVLVQGADLLRRGISVILFPQSTRNAVFDAAEFNTLGVKLARRAGVPVLPLALKTDFFAPGRRWKDLSVINCDRVVHYEFGPHLAATGTGREAHRQIVDFIAERFSAWGGTVRMTAENEHDT